MMTILCVIGMVIIISLVICGVEMKRAIKVPNDMPFLWGDYDPNYDETLKHEINYCDNCSFYQQKECTLMKKGTSDDEKVRICKDKKWFEHRN